MRSGHELAALVSNEDSTALFDSFPWLMMGACAALDHAMLLKASGILMHSLRSHASGAATTHQAVHRSAVSSPFHQGVHKLQ